MPHPDHSGRPQTAEGSVRQLKALRLMIVVLIPVAIWTVVGLIAFWPGPLSGHVRQDLSQYSVQGLTLPTGEITRVTPVSCNGQVGSTGGGQSGSSGTCATIEVRLLDGPEKGQQVQVSLTDAVYASGASVGEKVKLFRVPTDAAPAYQFSDFDRTVPMVVIALVFAAVVIAVARWRGLASLLGLGFAGFILLKFLFPALVEGANPVAVGLIASSAIMFVVLYAAHGFSARTTTALLGTLFGLVVSAGLGWAASSWAHLTGVASDDDYLLSATAPDLKLTSVVICGVIVAGLGVLNDVTITQASAVWELAELDPDRRKLFSRAMRIGRDHIASTVYTIAFATAGATLGALLLIAIYDRPLFEVLQTEAFAGEIVRTLVGSIGLVLAVPLTTAIGVAVVRAGDRGAARQLGRPVAAPEGAVALTPVAITPVALTPDARTDQEGVAPVSPNSPASPESPASPGSTASSGPTPEPTPEPTAETLRDDPASASAPEPKSGSETGAGGRQRRFRLPRRRPDDDVDFSDLRDPDDPAPPRRGR